MRLEIPDQFLSVPYDGTKTPDVEGELSQGANCQRFAYALLRHFGIALPPFYSSDLWDDESHTRRAAPPFEPLDLLLFNATENPYGGHVALCIGEGEVIHLSQRVGKPVIWPIPRFAAEAGYEILIGAKRPLHRTAQ